MMHLYEIASDDFILFYADQTVAQTTQVVRRLNPTRLIVSNWDKDTTSHYLYTPKEFLDLLAQVDGTQPLVQALQLSQREPIPALDFYADATRSPLLCVVIDDERVVGFYDVSLSPGEPIRRDNAKATDTEVSRSLKADFPDKMAKQEEASLLVWLAREMGKKPLRPVPLGSELDIVVQVQRGFALVGSGEGRLTVTDEEETLPIQFKLRATEIGPARIRVLCFQGGQPLGQVILSPTVMEAEERVNLVRSKQKQALAPFAIVQPDLTLRIFEKTAQDQTTIRIELHALDPKLALNWAPFGPITLQMAPQQYFQDFFRDIEGLKVDSLQKRAIAARRLALKGAGLFEDLLPEELRGLFWKLRQRIKTVQVLSDDPWIPWEMLQLHGEEDGELVDGPFLCEGFTMTRWFPGIGRRPTLRCKRLAVVIPAGSGLVHAKDERDYLRSLANPSRQVSQIPATYLDVLDALCQGEHDTWHFTGHGHFKGYRNTNRWALQLEDGEELYADEIRGRVRNCGRTQPLVFLNGCQTGRQSLALTGIGGWAKRFIDAGAAAFIGSLWSVYDKTAHQFAKAFYSHLLAGKTIGEATKKAREAIRQRNDSTWLAYTVFADPLARVSQESAQSQ